MGFDKSDSSTRRSRNHRKLKTRVVCTPGGLPVWTVIGYLKTYNFDAHQMLEDLEEAVTSDDIHFAEQYYEKHRNEVDAKLRGLEGP